MSSLSLEWRRFVLEQMARGVSDEKLTTLLQKAGLQLEFNTLQTLREDPALDVARRLAVRVAQLEANARLRTALTHLEVDVPRVKDLSGERFAADFYAQNRPVVLEDVVARTFGDEFIARVREVLSDRAIDVCVGREAHQRPDAGWRALTQKMVFEDYWSRVERETGNDLYMIANHKILDDERVFAGLTPHIACDERYLDPERLKGQCSLWIGPAGTITPLHHDTCNILFCQLQGTKRFTLCPLSESAFLQRCDDVYAERKHLEHVDKRVVELNAGDALFIPVGVWHEVVSSGDAPNASFSFLNFRWNNRFDYLPGAMNV